MPTPTEPRPWQFYTSPWWLLCVTSTVAVTLAIALPSSWEVRALLVLPLLNNGYTAWLMGPSKRRQRTRRANREASHASG